jgi:hypothetical protein
MPRSKKQPEPEPEPEPQPEREEEEDCSDADSEINDLVESSLQNVLFSKSSSSHAFGELNRRLLSSGTKSTSNLETKNGVVSAGKKSREGAFDGAIQRSAVYDARLLAAPAPTAKSGKKSPSASDIEPVRMDEDIKRDLKVISMRNHLDPKRFYKNPDKPGKILHVGTVIEGRGEYKSSRLTRRERKQTIVEEVLADKSLKNYTKKTFLKYQDDAGRKGGRHGARDKGGKAKKGRGKLRKYY